MIPEDVLNEEYLSGVIKKSEVNKFNIPGYITNIIDSVNEEMVYVVIKPIR